MDAVEGEEGGAAAGARRPQARRLQAHQGGRTRPLQAHQGGRTRPLQAHQGGRTRPLQAHQGGRTRPLLQDTPPYRTCPLQAHQGGTGHAPYKHIKVGGHAPYGTCPLQAHQGGRTRPLQAHQCGMTRPRLQDTPPTGHAPYKHIKLGQDTPPTNTSRWEDMPPTTGHAPYGTCPLQAHQGGIGHAPYPTRHVPYWIRPLQSLLVQICRADVSEVPPPLPSPLALPPSYRPTCRWGPSRSVERTCPRCPSPLALPPPSYRPTCRWGPSRSVERTCPRCPSPLILPPPPSLLQTNLPVGTVQICRADVSEVPLSPHPPPSPLPLTDQPAGGDRPDLPSGRVRGAPLPSPSPLPLTDQPAGGDRPDLPSGRVGGAPLPFPLPSPSLPLTDEPPGGDRPDLPSGRVGGASLRVRWRRGDVLLGHGLHEPDALLRVSRGGVRRRRPVPQPALPAARVPADARHPGRGAGLGAAHARRHQTGG